MNQKPWLEPNWYKDPQNRADVVDEAMQHFCRGADHSGGKRVQSFKWDGPLFLIECAPDTQLDLAGTNWLQTCTSKYIGLSRQVRWPIQTVYLDFRTSWQRFKDNLARKWPACSRKFCTSAPSPGWIGQHDWQSQGSEDVAVAGDWGERTFFWCRDCGAHMERDDWSGAERSR